MQILIFIWLYVACNYFHSKNIWVARNCFHLKYLGVLFFVVVCFKIIYFLGSLILIITFIIIGVQKTNHVTVLKKL